MNLVTIYDYQSDNTAVQKLLICWIRHVNKFAKGANVYLVHGDKTNSDTLNRLLQNEISNINLIKIKGEKCPILYDVPRIDNNFHVNFNLYNVMQVGKKINQPLIYLDLDAILVSNLNEWWEYVNEKNFIGTMHYPIGQNLNGGIYSISNHTEINFEELIKRFFLNHKRYTEIQSMCSVQSSDWCGMRNYTLRDSVFTDTGSLKSGDQSLFINYYVNTNRTPYYEKHDVAWNMFANYTTYSINDNGFIDILSIRNRMGFDVKKIKVLHAYAGAKKILVNNIKNSNYYR